MTDVGTGTSRLLCWCGVEFRGLFRQFRLGVHLHRHGKEWGV